MRQINEYINYKEGGSSFENEVKYSKSDWEKWLKLVDKEEYGKDLMIGNYESQPELTLVYRVNHDKKMMDHIATYDTKKEVLWCDDINIFGNEV